MDGTNRQGGVLSERKQYRRRYKNIRRIKNSK